MPQKIMHTPPFTTTLAARIPTSDLLRHARRLDPHSPTLRIGQRLWEGYAQTRRELPDRPFSALAPNTQEAALLLCYHYGIRQALLHPVLAAHAEMDDATHDYFATFLASMRAPTDTPVRAGLARNAGCARMGMARQFLYTRTLVACRKGPADRQAGHTMANAPWYWQPSAPEDWAQEWAEMAAPDTPLSPARGLLLPIPLASIGHTRAGWRTPPRIARAAEDAAVDSTLGHPRHAPPPQAADCALTGGADALSLAEYGPENPDALETRHAHGLIWGAIAALGYTRDDITHPFDRCSHLLRRALMPETGTDLSHLGAALNLTGERMRQLDRVLHDSLRLVIGPSPETADPIGMAGRAAQAIAAAPALFGRARAQLFRQGLLSDTPVLSPAAPVAVDSRPTAVPHPAPTHPTAAANTAAWKAAA